jgi:hypothetical protein
VLKFTWYDRLGPGEMYLTNDHRTEARELETAAVASREATAPHPA